MTRVLLLGTGPLPASNPKLVDFPRLRTWQFLRGLLDAGRDVWLVQAVRRARPRWREQAFDGHRLRILSVSATTFDRADLPTRWIDESGADAVVSAGPFGPAKAAARIPRGVPVLIDLPGDPMAEAQLRATSSGDGSHVLHARRLMDAVLHRGDAWSVVSVAQRYALLGQLGLSGRLGNQVPVFVVPVAVEPMWRTWAGKTGASSPRQKGKVIWPGSFNTWAATDLFLQASEIAMSRNPDIHVVATGGPIRHHAEQVHASVVQRIQGSRWRHRWRLTGWLDAVAAARELCSASVGVMLDRPCAEAELGSRTRLLYGAVLGLPWIVTPRCELARQLVALGAARGVHELDATSVANLILDAAASVPPPLHDLEISHMLDDTYSFRRTVAPIAQWTGNPAPAPPPAQDVTHAAAEQVATLERALAEVHNSATWRTLAPFHRMLTRVAGKRR